MALSDFQDFYTTLIQKENAFQLVIYDLYLQDAGTKHMTFPKNENNLTVKNMLTKTGNEVFNERVIEHVTQINITAKISLYFVLEYVYLTSLR